MTREDVKKLFPDATDEQITGLLNQTHDELEAEKEKTKQYKLDAQKVVDLQKQLEGYKNDKAKIAELQKQLDDINSQNMTELEKAQKDLERLQAESEAAIQKEKERNAELEKEMKKSETLKRLAELGITGDDAANFFGENGEVNFETLGKVISDRESAAAIAKEQAIAKTSTNPNGGSDVKGKDEKPADVENAQSISFGGLDKDAQTARDYYK